MALCRTASGRTPTPWWAIVDEDDWVILSLDIVALASDLPPVSVGMAVRNIARARGGQPGIEFVEVTDQNANTRYPTMIGRSWLKVYLPFLEQYEFDVDEKLLADMESVASAPDTPDSVEYWKEVGGGGPVARFPTKEVVEELSLSLGLGDDETQNPNVLEGRLRQPKPDRNLLVHIMERGDDNAKLAALTHAISTRDAMYVRPALLVLASRLRTADWSSDLTQWAWSVTIAVKTGAESPYESVMDQAGPSLAPGFAAAAFGRLYVPSARKLKPLSNSLTSIEDLQENAYRWLDGFPVIRSQDPRPQLEEDPFDEDPKANEPSASQISAEFLRTAERALIQMEMPVDVNEVFDLSSIGLIFNPARS